MIPGTRGYRTGVLLAAVLLIGLSSCAVQGLAFREDDRVKILRPDDRATVRLPVTIDWTVRDFEVGRGAGSFGVLVDRAPPPPGKTLAWLFRGRDECGGRPGCPTVEYMAESGVVSTTRTSYTIEHLNRPAEMARREFHEVTIILLDASGVRVGEAAWFVQFEVARKR